MKSHDDKSLGGHIRCDKLYDNQCKNEIHSKPQSPHSDPRENIRYDKVTRTDVRIINITTTFHGSPLNI